MEVCVLFLIGTKCLSSDFCLFCCDLNSKGEPNNGGITSSVVQPCVMARWFNSTTTCLQDVARTIATWFMCERSFGITVVRQTIYS